jgi:hypothetical protein
MSYGRDFTYKLKNKFLAADIFDGRLEKFDLKERQWEDESLKQWAARYRRRTVSDGKDSVTVEVELDGSVEYVGYSWDSSSGRRFYPDILEQLVKALNTEAEEVCCMTESDLQLLIYCDEHGIDPGLERDPNDPLRHEKWIEWERSGRHAQAEAAADEHAKKHTPRFDPAELPRLYAVEADAGSGSKDLSDEPF